MLIDTSYIGNSSKTGVYFIRNNINGKLYVGSTKSKFHARKTRHKRSLELGNHDNEHLQSSWDKYGEVNFTFGIFYVTNMDIELWEYCFMSVYKTLDRSRGYNKRYPAIYSAGYKLPIDKVKTMSDIKKNKAKIRSGHSNAERGLCKEYLVYDRSKNFLTSCNSNEELANYIGANKTYTSRLLSKQKFCFCKGFLLTVPGFNVRNVPEYTDRLNKIDVYDINCNILMEGVTVKEASAHIGCEEAEVRMCYTGKRSYVKGFITSIHKVPPNCLDNIPNSHSNILQKDLEGNLIKVWEGTDALLGTEFKRNDVVRVLRGERKTYKNFKWERKGTTKKN